LITDKYNALEKKGRLLTFVEFENGVHGFDSEQKSDPRASEIISQTLDFMRMNFGLSGRGKD